MKKIFFILTLSIASWSQAQTSVLSSGSWCKIGVTESGMHKIDANTLQALGINISSLDPEKLKIYGNGVKGALPQRNSEPRPSDLLENAILISGGEDGSFDQDDYILFYAMGPNKENWTSSGFEYQKNIYSDTSYYFINTDGKTGKRIDQKPSLDDVADEVINSYDDHITYERDDKNLIASGRGWFGELITDGNSKVFNHQMEGITSDVAMHLSVVSQSAEDNSFDIFANESLQGTIDLRRIAVGVEARYSIKARQNESLFLIPQNSSLDIRIKFNANSVNGRGFIDFYTLTFERDLALYGNETVFRSIDTLDRVSQYEIENASNSQVWNISDPTTIHSQQFSQSGNKALFKSRSNSVEEFVVFKGIDFPTPFIFGAISNQNLRNTSSFDGIIITIPKFLDQANRLAQFHRDNSELKIKVVTTREIYNEFSSGRQDISAIRDYAKYVYDRGGILKYLTLFGDCSYDYKDRVANNTNFVPTYESYENFDPVLTYSSDDFYGFFEEEEGDWIESIAGDHTMEIGVGRLPVKTIEEAQVVVDKIIYYSTNPATLGKWRNEIAYLADDGDTNTHVEDLEQLSELIDTLYTQYTIKKLILDAFDQVEGASRDTSPQLESALKTQIKNGAFTINFMGHGSEEQWTDEDVFNIDIIENLTNKNKLPIFVTATCEFGRYDDPSKFSGSERLLLSSTGGAIALLTTSRPVYAFSNFDLNEAFHNSMYKKVNGQYQRLGDIIRATKNNGLVGANNRNFTLLGDPMMMPSFPELDIIIDELISKTDTLSALEEVTFTGKVQSNQITNASFNGKMAVAIYDIEQNFKTKGQESSPFTYSLRNNAIFKGVASVTNGTFQFTFIVPKNISYQYKRGKMSLYAWDTDGNIDASGSSREILFGGTSANPIVDSKSPTVNMYLNDESFNSGNTVGKSSLLFAKIEDENGITTSSNGIVKGITLNLNGEEFNLNEFYTADIDSYTNGTIAYPIQDLEPGSYIATIKVWDTSNNSTESTIHFEVSDKPELFIFNQKTYPNPATNGVTSFVFEHDREEEDLNVSIIVYNGRGGIVSNRSIQYENSSRRIEIPWETKTDSGQSLDMGIYFYRLIIQSDLDGAMKEISKKLVIKN